MRSTLLAVALALCAVLLPAATAQAGGIRISGSIVPGSEGTCTPPAVDGPLVRWQCVGATETYTGSLSSTADAVYSVRGLFNLRSGATITRGRETFTGCVEGACGTLEWRWHVKFRAVPETVEVLSGQGRARVTGGTGDLEGAKGSFGIECDPPAACAYSGHLSL